MRSLEDIIMENARPAQPINFLHGAEFVVGLKKMAEDIGAAPAQEAGPAHVGPFAVPTDQAVQLMAAMVANEFKTQVYYIFYANMLRGLGRAGIAQEFLDHAKDELKHATYLLRRIGVLSPGGVPIPNYPPPEPSSDAMDIIQKMIVVEEMGLALWRQLHSICGDSPMKYTIEQFLQAEEEHMDELWQLVEQSGTASITGGPSPEQAQAPAQPEPAKTQVKVETSAPQPVQPEEKLASILHTVQMRKMASEKDRLMADLALAVKADNKSEISRLKGMLDTHTKKTAMLSFVRTKKAMSGMMESPEDYIAREKALAAEQALAEAAHARTVAMQSTQAAQQAHSEAQAAQQQAAELQAQLEQQTMAAQQAQTQAMQSQQQAAEAEARAAEHSISKMQLGMRINQLRQELANFVMQDPVSETAATVSDLAAQGQPATPDQQMQAEALQAQGADPATANAAASGAMGAQQQAQPGQGQSQGGPPAAESGSEQSGPPSSGESPKGEKKDGTSVTVKTSGDEMSTIIGNTLRKGRIAAAPVAAAPAASVLPGAMGKLRAIAAHPAAKPLAIAGAGAAALGGAALLARHADRTQKAAQQAANVHAKTASPADRRLMQAIAEGGDDTLAHGLRGLLSVPRHIPQAPGASEAADALVNQGVDAARLQLSTLGERMRPHLPAFGAGAVTGALGMRALSQPAQPQQEWE